MYKILSLFANIGVGEFLINKPFSIVLANELEPERCRVYSKIYPNHRMIEGSIIDKKDTIISTAKDLGVDVVIATPPCQSFSIINNKKQIKDPRSDLVVHAIDIIKTIRPKLAIIENVTGQRCLYIGAQTYEEYVRAAFPEYNTIIDVLDAADYGVPQRRRRLFTIISKKDIKLPQKKKHITLREAIGDLPSVEAHEKTNDPMHFGPNNSPHHVLWAKHTETGLSAFSNFGKNEYYPQMPGGRKIKGYDTTYRRMFWDSVSYTLTMNHAGPNGSNTLHPGTLLPDGTYSDARTLTLREAARIMGLPDTFDFPDGISYRKGMQYLGEGLSPVVLKSLLDSWEGSDE